MIRPAWEGMPVDSLADLVTWAAEEYGERIAFRLEAAAPEAWSFLRIARAADAIAAELRGPRGVGRGERVLVWGSASSPRLTATYLGCIRAGIVLVPIDPRSTTEFVARVAAQTEARALIVDGAQGDDLELPRIPIDELPDGSEAAAPTPPPDRPTRDDLAEIVFTSGTTGEPKGVMLTHGNILANITSIHEILPRADYRLISLLPVSHMLEQTPSIFTMIDYGAEVTYVPSRLPATIMDAMQRRRPNMMVVVPLLLELLMAGIEREVRAQGKWRLWQGLNVAARALPMAGRRLLFRSVLQKFGGALELIFCGGARLAPEVALAWERMGIRVVEGYGATECSPLVTANAIDRRHFGSVGRAVRDVEVRVSPEGELQVRGPNVTQGYWRNPEATAAAFTADGWYRTGDLAEIDRYGDVRLHGRLRDMIVLSSGLNVYPEDPEAALRNEPEVTECVALLLPDADHRERISAVIVPSKDGGDATDAALAAAVQRANRHLAPHQRMTGHIRWPDADFPRTTSMKVQRRLVLERLRELGLVSN